MNGVEQSAGRREEGGKRGDWEEGRRGEGGEGEGGWEITLRRSKEEEGSKGVITDMMTKTTKTGATVEY